ncbi:GntR family transcriptional regulator [Gordonia sp. zg691]|uniref:GntR family transcriptional regulator n=1 Tax=Gordonia jinghuaiqii TaxID=2758710 RepID=A0A7D7R618_9ACTN|nr:GntR family transcriptional regulator [Gordonia jinghuaiqii]MBD0863485.1 GntR family transcriptional regulator [Gordonia jinghuaiqii]QMT04027.1 GntR family transcriptional regulator [Gordonia jinghuaiqii]
MTVTMKVDAETPGPDDPGASQTPVHQRKQGGSARRRVLTPLVQESTPAIIARKLHNAIANGDFPPGSQLTESGLAADLGVSRGPLREAMQRLTAEGLLVSHRNRGLFVVSMEDDDIRDMYVARTAVERAALQQVIAHREDDAVRALGEAVEAMREFIDEPNGAGMAEADMGFHQTLVDFAGSQRLSRLHETILVETRMCLRAMRGTYSSGKDRIAEHQMLVDAIAAGDAAAADALMIEHMADGLRRLIGDGAGAGNLQAVSG